MSYNPHTNEDRDSLSALFSTINDCIVACKNMLRNKDNALHFVRWFEKAKLIDPRTTYLFLKEHLPEFSTDCRSICLPFMEKMESRKKKKSPDQG